MTPDKDFSFKKLTANQDIKQADAAIEMMLLEIDGLNVPRDVLSRRFFEYGFEFAQPSSMQDHSQLTTWLAILEQQKHRISELQGQITNALKSNAMH